MALGPNLTVKKLRLSAYASDTSAPATARHLDTTYQTRRAWRRAWRFVHAKWRPLNHRTAQYEFLHGRFGLKTSYVSNRDHATFQSIEDSLATMLLHRRAPDPLATRAIEIEDTTDSEDRGDDHADGGDGDNNDDDDADDVWTIDLCPFCQLVPDNSDHYFFHCPGSVDLWTTTLPLAGLTALEQQAIEAAGFGIQNLLLCWPDRRCSRRLQAWHSAVVYVLHDQHQRAVDPRQTYFQSTPEYLRRRVLTEMQRAL